MDCVLQSRTFPSLFDQRKVDSTSTCDEWKIDKAKIISTPQNLEESTINEIIQISRKKPELFSRTMNQTFGSDTASYCSAFENQNESLVKAYEKLKANIEIESGKNSIRLFVGTINYFIVVSAFFTYLFSNIQQEVIFLNMLICLGIVALINKAIKKTLY